MHIFILWSNDDIFSEVDVPALFGSVIGNCIALLTTSVFNCITVVDVSCWVRLPSSELIEARLGQQGRTFEVCCRRFSLARCPYQQCRRRGMVTALKLVWVEKVRRPERSKPCDPTNSVLPWEKPARWDRRNRPRLSKSGPRAVISGPEHHPLYIYFLFLFGFWLYLSHLFFSFYWPKRPSMRARELCSAHHAPVSGHWRMWIKVISCFNLAIIRNRMMRIILCLNDENVSLAVVRDSRVSWWCQQLQVLHGNPQQHLHRWWGLPAWCSRHQAIHLDMCEQLTFSCQYRLVRLLHLSNI